MRDLQFQQGIPRSALALDLQRADGRRRAPSATRRVLVYAELLGQTERYLRERGALLTRAPSAEEAVRMLAAERFDIVLLDPHAPGGGLHLVKVLKLGHRTLDLPEKLIREATARARLTPFVIVAVDGSTEYAVILQAPELAFLEDGSKLRMEDAILQLDSARLLTRAGPSA
jgi:hypothetical protein